MKKKETLALIGQNIQRYRIKDGMTQVQFADQCQIQKSAISRIEGGKTNMTIKTPIRIANALQLDLADLIH